MTTPAIVFLVGAGLFAVGDWVAKARRHTVLEYVCKPTALLALIGTALVLTPMHDAEARRVWFVAALVFSLAGDVFLMLPTDRFVAGLAAFLVAHVCYVGGFWTKGPGGIALRHRRRRGGGRRGTGRPTHPGRARRPP